MKTNKLVTLLWILAVIISFNIPADAYSQPKSINADDINTIDNFMIPEKAAIYIAEFFVDDIV